MGRVSGPVAVVTTFDGDVPRGTTVSSLISLSLSPVLLLVALDRGSQLLARLSPGTAVGVNVLASHQDQIALRFASKREDKFADIGWLAKHGAPMLDEAHAWVAGTVESLLPGGDHVIVVAAVVDARLGDGAPLSYHDRTFGTHAPF